jgi:Flp pilus assembly pilin Flp
MKNLLKFLWQEQKGQDLIEYAQLLSLIALGAIVSMKTIASTINAVYKGLFAQPTERRSSTQRSHL